MLKACTTVTATTRNVPLAHRLAAILLTIAVAASQALPAQATEAAVKRADRLSIVRVAALHDSLTNFDIVSGLTQWQRLDSRRVAIAPLPGSSVNALAVVDLGSLDVRVLASAGSGPDQLTRRVVLSRGSDGTSLVLDLGGPGAVKRFDRNGRAVERWRAPQFGFGLTECSGRVFVLGSIRRDGAGAWQGGLFELQRDAEPVLRHPLVPVGITHPRPEFPQLADSRDSRIVAASSAQAELHISDSSCDRFQTVRLDLPWFSSLDTIRTEMPWAHPAPHVINGVRWYDERHVALLLQRPNPDAKYFTDATSRNAPQAPRGLRPLTETVLAIADSRTGRIVAEAVLARAGWSFVSGREVVKRRIDDDLETMELWSFRLEQRP